MSTEVIFESLTRFFLSTSETVEIYLREKEGFFLKKKKLIYYIGNIFFRKKKEGNL